MPGSQGASVSLPAGALRYWPHKSKLSHEREATAGKARLKREAELVVRRGADEGFIDEAGGEIPQRCADKHIGGKMIVPFDAYATELASATFAARIPARS
jgi:hypothetical protein